MKYNVLYGVVIGISCNFIYSMNESESVLTIDTVSISDELRDQLQTLHSKVDQLYAQVNPSMIKSLLSWSGKWAVRFGVFCFVVRYWLDLASPQDAENAVNKLYKKAQDCDQELSEYTRQRMAEINSFLHGKIAEQQDQQSYQLKQFERTLNSRIVQVNGMTVDVEKLILDNPNIVSRLAQYADQQKAVVKEFGQQLGSGFVGLRDQADEIHNQQQLALGDLHQNVGAALTQSQLLSMQALQKSKQVERDRESIQRMFEIGRAQQQQLRGSQRKVYPALTN